MKTILGTEGGSERVILCASRSGLYVAVRPHRRYYRLAVGVPFGLYVGRS